MLLITYPVCVSTRSFMRFSSNLHRCVVERADVELLHIISKAEREINRFSEVISEIILTVEPSGGILCSDVAVLVGFTSFLPRCLMKGYVIQTGGAYEIFTIISGRIELNL